MMYYIFIVGKYLLSTFQDCVIIKRGSLWIKILIDMEQNKISEDETQKYALRPRKDLKKPTRIRSNYYEY